MKDNEQNFAAEVQKMNFNRSIMPGLFRMYRHALFFIHRVGFLSFLVFWYLVRVRKIELSTFATLHDDFDMGISVWLGQYLYGGRYSHADIKVALFDVQRGKQVSELVLKHRNVLQQAENLVPAPYRDMSEILEMMTLILILIRDHTYYREGRTWADIIHTVPMMIKQGLSSDAIKAHILEQIERNGWQMKYESLRQSHVRATRLNALKIED